MKKTLWSVCTLTLLASLILLGRPATARAAEGDDQARLERLEHRLNELAQRQEQMMNRLGAPAERRSQMASPEGSPLRPQLAPPAAPPTAPAAPAANRACKGLHDLLGMLFFIGMICNILLAVWIFTDIRKRGEGSGIFIVLALFAGIPSAIIYALTRIGDRKP